MRDKKKILMQRVKTEVAGRMQQVPPRSSSQPPVAQQPPPLSQPVRSSLFSPSATSANDADLAETELMSDIMGDLANMRRRRTRASNSQDLDANDSFDDHRIPDSSHSTEGQVPPLAQPQPQALAQSGTVLNPHLLPYHASDALATESPRLPVSPLSQAASRAARTNSEFDRDEEPRSRQGEPDAPGQA
ncbi:MAG: hypothetical protein MHM6MM_006505 [Cercozoa sp. M6MM]